jgi:hypothetical protein
MLRDLIESCLTAAPLEPVMATLRRLTELDRYQASLGIERAAELVADAARAFGVADVEIRRYPADGKRRWWSFRAPVSWTPTRAVVEVLVGGERAMHIDHGEQPFSLATYSAPTDPGDVAVRVVSLAEFRADAPGRGALVAVRRTEFRGTQVIDELLARGALGFVTDAAACGKPPEAEYRGRIELASDARVVGFSVTTSELDQLLAYAAQGATARVDVQVDRSASMPVVTGVLPGSGAGPEIWLTSHLCHPRPGANDNGSGVVGLLGVAAIQKQRRGAGAAPGSSTLRFVWGPEFLGVAAFLHDRRESAGKGALPAAVVNLDMIGEDQELCQCPFLLERCPEFTPSLLTPIAEHVVQSVFERTAASPGTWQAVPFMGFSDHALFAAPQIACPAVQLCHVPDRFNHSAGDSLDKVSALELRRSIAVGAALAEVLSNRAALSPAHLDTIVTTWCERERRTARDIAEASRRSGHVDWAAAYLDHVLAAGAGMRSLLLDAEAPPRSGPAVASGGLRVQARWSGPFNARAMFEDLSPGRRSAVLDLIAARKTNLALLLQFALRCDGQRTRRDVIRETSFAHRRPIASSVSDTLFDALLESGWVEEGCS